MNLLRAIPSPKAAFVTAVVLALCFGTAAQAQVQHPQALYMVSVGVSQYQNPGMNLQSAAKDAADVANTFRAQQGKLFGHVDVTTLTNAQATAYNITNAVNQLRTKTNPYSYVIVYLAGHGDSNHDGEFFFNAYDFNPLQKAQTSVSWRQLQQALTGMPGKVIIILDSCRSGAVGQSNDLIVISSAMAHQNAGESHLNGWFTQALIEGLTGKADFNHDGKVTLAEIDLYVSERVEQLSGGKQQMTMTRPPNVPSTMPLVSLLGISPAVAVTPTQPVVTQYQPVPAANNFPVMSPPSTFNSSGPIDRPPRAAR